MNCGSSLRDTNGKFWTPLLFHETTGFAGHQGRAAFALE
jgi:hypothetical protein